MLARDVIGNKRVATKRKRILYFMLLVRHLGMLSKTIEVMKCWEIGCATTYKAIRKQYTLWWNVSLPYFADEIAHVSYIAYVVRELP